MDKEEKWLVDLAALVSASRGLTDFVPCEVGFEIAGKRRGLDLIHGRITDGASAQCWLSGTNSDFSELIAGALTLQRAHLTGRIKLSGEPEALLRLAFILDVSSSSGKNFNQGSFDAGSHV